MNDLENNPLFFEDSQTIIKEETWGGAENKVSSIAFNVSEESSNEVVYDHVLKEPQKVNYVDALAKKYPPKNNIEIETIKDLSNYFNSKERFINSQKDWKLMEEIFVDTLPKTQYIIGEPRFGNDLGFYIIQEKVHGETWSKFASKKSREENQNFMMEHRDQLIKLIGGAIKTLIETGGTVDIWGDNLMVDENNHFFLVDPGVPSDLNRHFDKLLKLPEEMRELLSKNLLTRVSDLDKYPSSINMSDEEISKMYEDFEMTKKQYEEAKNQLIEKCKVLVENK